MAQRQDYSCEETKIVGDRGCTFGSLVLALSGDEAASISLRKEWKQLARELEIKKADVMDLEDDLAHRRKQTPDVIEAIFEKWRSKNANRATLRALITACTNIGLEDVATVLETIQNGALC